LLEADSKSLRSVNGSRRNSSGSLVSSSSASSNLSHLEEDTWILWGRLINEWEDVRKKKEKLLRVSYTGRLADGLRYYMANQLKREALLDDQSSVLSKIMQALID
ncbi:hypothetical protein chiPu_0024105, partial [Chiloscyllium punctatum]|nr:hypothetical protein [Chiloscyllium punctatum]